MNQRDMAREAGDIVRAVNAARGRRPIRDRIETACLEHEARTGQPPDAVILDSEARAELVLTLREHYLFGAGQPPSLEEQSFRFDGLLVLGPSNYVEVRGAVPGDGPPAAEQARAILTGSITPARAPSETPLRPPRGLTSLAPEAAAVVFSADFFLMNGEEHRAPASQTECCKFWGKTCPGCGLWMHFHANPDGAFYECESCHAQA